MKRTEMTVQMPPYVDIYVRLSSVCGRFYRAITDRRFRNIIARSLNGLLFLSMFLLVAARYPQGPLSPTLTLTVTLSLT